MLFSGLVFFLSVWIQFMCVFPFYLRNIWNFNWNLLFLIELNFVHEWCSLSLFLCEFIREFVCSFNRSVCVFFSFIELMKRALKINSVRKFNTKITKTASTKNHHLYERAKKNCAYPTNYTQWNIEECVVMYMPCTWYFFWWNLRKIISNFVWNRFLCS